MGSNKMLRAGLVTGGYLVRNSSDPDCPSWWRDIPIGSTLRRAAIGTAAAIVCLALLAGCSNAPLVTSVDLFCTRVDRFHATDGEREFLKANSGPLERLIRWVAGINQQWDETCLKPGAGP